MAYVTDTILSFLSKHKLKLYLIPTCGEYQIHREGGLGLRSSYSYLNVEMRNNPIEEFETHQKLSTEGGFIRCQQSSKPNI